MTAGKSSASRSDMLWLYVANTLILIAGLAVYRVASQVMPESGFAEYALSRRTVSFLSPALLLGMGVGLPRYLAQAVGPSRVGLRSAYYQGAVVMVVGAHVLIGLVFASAPSFSARLFFGTAGLAELLLPMLVLVLALSLHTMQRNSYRGLFRFRAAGLIDSINLGVLPVAAIVVFGPEVGRIVLATGIAVLVVCAFAALDLRELLASPRVARVGAMRELLTYGVPRIPGDFALGGLLAVPSFLTAHFAGPTEAGYVAFGTTLVSLGGAAVAPISMALLPQAAHQIGKGDWTALRADILKVAIGAGAIGIGGVVVALVGMDAIVTGYLGERYLAAVPVLRVMAICAVPYVMFCALRSFLDAAYARAVNAQNSIVALVLMLVATKVFALFQGNSVGAVMVGMLVGYFGLGIATVRDVWQLFARARTLDKPGLERSDGEVT